ncbi:MAG: hypothetical protein HRU32_15085, partial [Rhodobacteraceae bacterium]|nr:hypothetical protein [Paracoccaceae bacterium]
MGAWAFALAMVCAAPGMAQELEKISFSVAGNDEELTERLIAGSALVSARENEVTDVQELIAIARNDYGRMVS